MQQHRAGESCTIPFRNERYFCANGVWFFETRGGKQQGPFLTKNEMEGELVMYIREQTLLDQTLREIS
ncbi:MAG: hypothetical protein DIZ80_09620 [endosymbiont of Galathealinum brachiosum]|uniref:DUF6316 domain-containing protein n=1 Tax=endosymbiont of Galathealinum brachiosum TaxID=2200906 RepID=A0A370DDS5_9GAMM|nr:MAG: hypothetical protein DIZ80_09620 [endosymbiont of Galathealinum brachiosum]